MGKHAGTRTLIHRVTEHGKHPACVRACLGLLPPFPSSLKTGKWQGRKREMRAGGGETKERDNAEGSRKEKGLSNAEREA